VATISASPPKEVEEGKFACVRRSIAWALDRGREKQLYILLIIRRGLGMHIVAALSVALFARVAGNHCRFVFGILCFPLKNIMRQR
jgi:hypothetical protein